MPLRSTRRVFWSVVLPLATVACAAPADDANHSPIAAGGAGGGLTATTSAGSSDGSSSAPMPTAPSATAPVAMPSTTPVIPVSGVAGEAPSGGAGMPSSVGGSGGVTPAQGGDGPVSGGEGGSNPAGGPSNGVAGGGVGGGFVAGDPGAEPMVEPLDCGPNGTALENHGPPSNRVNYVIVGDGYSEQDLAEGGTLDQHLEAMLAKRFSDPIGQPYLRYRRFVNICVLRFPSGPICGQSEFGCCGDDQSRLANCDGQAVNNAMNENLPESFEVDWRAVVLNGDSWWNSGGTLMMWSGGNQDAGGAALHEGGHGHNFISDEYGNCEQGRVSREMTYGVNVSLMDGETGGRWDGWLGYDQSPGTGEQTIIPCDGNATFRPTQNSMMNSLFGDDPDTSYNSVSREKVVMDVWRIVERPFDSVTPEEGAVTNPTTLTVHVIDPEVISVDWALDGETVATDGGPSYDIAAAGLAPGPYTVTARAYDNAGEDLVRQVPDTVFNRQYWGAGEMGHSDRSVTWTVTVE